MSTSRMMVINSSFVSFAPPMVFFLHSFMDLTILSNRPPHQGALSRLAIHLTLFSAKHCFTPGFLISSVIYLDADLKVVPLCETIWKGKPCLAVNLQKLLRNASGVKFGTMQVCQGEVLSSHSTCIGKSRPSF